MYYRLITPVITLLLCAVFYSLGLFGILSETSLDHLFRLRGERPTSQEIVIIGVDEESLAALGAWPFSRDNHAELLTHLKESKVVAFDFLFNDPTVADAQFSAALKMVSPVILATATDYNQQISSPSPTLSGFNGTGSINTIMGNRGIVRKTQVSLDSELSPSLSQAMLVAGNSPFVYPSESEPFINFYGPEFTFLSLSYSDVLKGKIPPTFFKDRYVFIGAEAIGLGDVHLTPFSSQYPTPGVEIQATILNNLLDGDFLKTTVVPNIIAILFLCFTIFAWHRMAEIQIFFLNTVIVASLFIIAFYSFRENYFFDPSFPVATIAIAYLVHLIIQGLWTARELVKRIAILDTRLQKGLEELYVNIPPKELIPNQKQNGKKLFLTKGIHRHIEQLERGTQALAIQNHFINHLLKEEAPPIAIWEEENGTLLIANTSFAALWQSFKKNSAMPKFSVMQGFIAEYSLSHDEDVYEEFEKLVTERVLFSTDICLTSGGRRQFFQVTVQPIDPEGAGFSGYLCNLTDVTGIHELERVKAEVLSIVSHELKLPLTVILGYGEMLADTLPEGQAQCAEEICTHTRRLNQMIVEFLDIERIESGKYVLHSFPFDLLNILNDGISAVTHSARQKDISLHLTAPANVSSFVGDESLLLQVYINLLDNAVKYSSSGTRVEIELVEQKHAMVLTIADQGFGISEEKQLTIFNKFSRGEHSQLEKGFGLGLSLVDQVVKSHGGTIEVVSREKKGTTFSIKLPKKLI